MPTNWKKLTERWFETESDRKRKMTMICSVKQRLPYELDMQSQSVSTIACHAQNSEWQLQKYVENHLYVMHYTCTKVTLCSNANDVRCSEENGTSRA